MIVPTLEDIWNFPYFQSIFSATVEQWIEKILFFLHFIFFFQMAVNLSRKSKLEKKNIKDFIETLDIILWEIEVLFIIQTKLFLRFF